MEQDEILCKNDMIARPLSDPPHSPFRIEKYVLARFRAKIPPILALISIQLSRHQDNASAVGKNIDDINCRIAKMLKDLKGGDHLEVIFQSAGKSLRVGRLRTAVMYPAIEPDVSKQTAQQAVPATEIKDRTAYPQEFGGGRDESKILKTAMCGAGVQTG
jgi:hypothetical protein